MSSVDTTPAGLPFSSTTTRWAVPCSVISCAHHCGDKDYCSLKEIKVGCSDPSVAKCDQTQCASFDLGTKGSSCCQ